MVSWAMPGIMDSTNDGLLIFQKADAILMGRAIYEGFASYWPFQEGEWADAMNQTQKFVATTTNNSELTEVRWGDYDDTISLLNSDVMSKVRELKKEIKGDIIVPASASLVQSLLSANLLDELRIIIHPVILGQRRTLFRSHRNTSRHEVNRNQALRNKWFNADAV
ncbi:dihydrofolate reductase family protein [Halalkalibacterium halodurans]|uniref:dihydrofolate reductase family protein n=1 Tax=Halalkalibacterium halodurans TaxID=86665 RepID=UPI002AA9AC7E|nr:dihydrofolate reductase family protein [Halalkalibacterium halodurans]MDY7224231.1 dihydrofolate reductase family protein [Halalkalibacterium halodurans]MDY7243516.1 dihydrofolate reductase family protein [Halalkalibacterium halodurans]